MKRLLLMILMLTFFVSSAFAGWITLRDSNLTELGTQANPLVATLSASSAFSLTGLSDVNSATASAGRLLVANGTGWDSIGTVNINSVTGTITANGVSISGSTDSFFDTDTLYVDSGNHRVGIGTASPSSELDVAGIITTTRGNGVMRFYGSTNDLRIDNQVSNGHIIIIPNGGNVGINKTTPTAKLEVSGDFLTSSGHITVHEGTVGGGETQGCIQSRDSDGAGWTAITTLNGALFGSVGSCP